MSLLQRVRDGHCESALRVGSIRRASRLNAKRYDEELDPHRLFWR